MHPYVLVFTRILQSYSPRRWTTQAMESAWEECTPKRSSRRGWGNEGKGNTHWLSKPWSRVCWWIENVHSPEAFIASDHSLSAELLVLEGVLADRVWFWRIGGVKLLIVLYSKGVQEGDSSESSAVDCNVEGFPIVMGGGPVIVIASRKPMRIPAEGERCAISKHH